MVVFLTSSFVEYQPDKEFTPKPLDSSNGFVDNLKKYWTENANFLVFSSNPADYEMSDHVVGEMFESFSLSGLSIGEIKCFDNRYIDAYKGECDSLNIAHAALKEALQWADVLYLAGGHAPTQNVFMKICGLKDLISDTEIFDGIIIGLSAGSVNAAENVYLIPELPGESEAADFVRFTSGLGLTGINMLPHSQYFENVILDGKHVIDDIVYEDSKGREIYLIPDGSYFIIRKGMTEFFGDGMIMENGEKRLLHSGIINEDSFRTRKAGKAVKYIVRSTDALVDTIYDWILELNLETEDIHFFKVSNLMLENGIIPVNIDTFDELNRIFSEKIIVKDEKQPYLDQIKTSIIVDEMKNKGSYVRTMHIDVGEGVQTLSLRTYSIPGDTSRILISLMDISMIIDHDALTDEYSRSGFLARAEKMLKEPEYQQGYSIIYTNVQGLKAVNDLLGIFSGDMVIYQERDILVKEFEPVLLARLESDHFALITKTEKITAETMERVCYQQYVEDSKCIPIRIHCGVYHIDDATKKISYMLDQAKIAENSISSSRGTPYAICDKRMGDDYVNQKLFISQLDKALDNNEFITYYQPIVDAKTGEIVSAEALIRWNHFERGMIPPGMFIPVFEKEGLITKLDSFMINSVIKFNMKRMRCGKKVVPCAVNLSRVDFYDTKLLSILKEKLAKQENIQNMLKLEVTESAYAVLESDAISFLEEMKKLGLSLLLDDFGSGMSSLSTLESFEFDVIKLDMGFIRKIGKSFKAEGIIKHTIGLAHDIGAKIVAEGVETQEQLEFLQSVDCDMIQGYYFYKPMPEDEFEQLLIN